MKWLVEDYNQLYVHSSLGYMSPMNLMNFGGGFITGDSVSCYKLTRLKP